MPLCKGQLSVTKPEQVQPMHFNIKTGVQPSRIYLMLAALQFWKTFFATLSCCRSVDYLIHCFFSPLTNHVYTYFPQLDTFYRLTTESFGQLQNDQVRSQITCTFSKCCWVFQLYCAGFLCRHGKLDEGL